MSWPRVEEKCLKLVNLAGLGIIALVFFTAGIIFLCINIPFSTFDQKCVTVTKYKYDLVSDAINYRDNCFGLNDKTCAVSPAFNCSCGVEWNVDKDIEGEIVIAYKLDTFNETIDRLQKPNEPNFYESKDNSQLQGDLNTNVSEACKPYDYDENNVPIAPCGALANAMLKDAIEAVEFEGSVTVPSVKIGLLHDSQKEGFRNPENLTFALQNFTKPINWTKSIWELDPEHPTNNGFQNEAFIAWMRQDLPVKPMWRLDSKRESRFQKGLGKGLYIIRMQYTKHFLYNGTRSLLVYRETAEEGKKCNDITVTEHVRLPGVGVAGVVIGALLLTVLSAALVWYKLRGSKVIDTGPPAAASVANNEETERAFLA